MRSEPRASRGRIGRAKIGKFNLGAESGTRTHKSIMLTTSRKKVERNRSIKEKSFAKKNFWAAPRRGGRGAGGGEPVFPSLAALRAAESVGKIPESLILVPRVGVEPT